MTRKVTPYSIQDGIQLVHHLGYLEQPTEQTWYEGCLALRWTDTAKPDLLLYAFFDRTTHWKIDSLTDNEGTKEGRIIGTYKERITGFLNIYDKWKEGSLS